MTKSDKPEPVLDLDALQEEYVKEDASEERFHVMVDGKKVHFESPNSLPWQDAEDLNRHINAGELTQALFILIKDDEELNTFFDRNFKSKVLERALNSYFKFHGYDPLRGQLNRADRRALARGR